MMIKTIFFKTFTFLALGFIFLSYIDNNKDIKDESEFINEVRDETEVDCFAKYNLPALDENWTLLLDDNLTYWEKWLGVVHTSVNLNGYPKSDDITRGTPIGLNKDPKNVYTVIEQGGEKILKITGEIYGGLTTKQEYGNFHFSVQFKWGQKKWEPRLNRKRDSGILYHCKGPHGAFWNTWKASLEFQVQESDCGDFISLAGVRGRVPAKRVNNSYKFEPKRIPVSSNFVTKSVNREKPNGQWNTLEVISIGDRSIHLVNGVLVNAIQDARFRNSSVTKGQIQIQSEAAEIYYKDIKIKSVKDFPISHLNALGWEAQDGSNTGDSDTNAPVGKVVALKKNGGDAKWITINENTRDAQLIANKESMSSAARFLIEEHPLGGIALRSTANGKYIQVQNFNDNKAIRAFGNGKGTWEQFSWKSKGNGKVALKSNFTGKWIQASWSRPNATLFPRGRADGDWEIFDFELINNNIPSLQKNDQISNRQLKIYPNPGSDVIIITGVPRNVDINFLDLLGRSFLLKENSISSKEREIDVSNLPKGMYLISVGSNENKLTFIKK